MRQAAPAPPGTPRRSPPALLNDLEPSAIAFRRSHHSTLHCYSNEVLNSAVRRSAGGRATQSRRMRESTTAALPPTESLGGHAARLIDRFRTRQARVGVIGLGYVGLPLAVEFASAGFHVIPVDVDSVKV